MREQGFPSQEPAFLTPKGALAEVGKEKRPPAVAKGQWAPWEKEARP